MTKNNNIRRTVGVACVVILLLVAGLLGSSRYGRSEVRKTWNAATGKRAAYSDLVEHDQNLGEILAGGTPFLFAIAICGLVTGILGAVVLPEGDAEPWDDFGDDEWHEQRKRDFAAAFATALPTIAVRLDSAGTPEQHPLTVIDDPLSSGFWARV